MGKSRRARKHPKAIGKRDDLKPILQAVALTIVVAFLFYRSVFALALGVVIVPFWMKLYKKEQQENRTSKMLQEFKEYMMLIAQGLQAGYSLERAIAQSEKELFRLYPKDSVLLPHVHIMNQKISMNVQLEKAFLEFGNAVGLEEAMSLAEIISFAKRSGGDYGKNIRETALKIEENLAVKQDIETITTEKRLELKVMCVMPIGILAYITITSKSFIAPLYGNLLGVVVMSFCLIAYGLLIKVGKRIIDIKI